LIEAHPATFQPPQRPLGLTVVLIAGILVSAIGAMLLLLAPWSLPGILDHPPHLVGGVGALTWSILVTVGLWRHTTWTWWLLAIPVYVLGLIGLLFVIQESDWIYRVRDGLRAILFLGIVGWYFHFNPAVVSYYAAIDAARKRQVHGSARDAA
jgi:hypothetical protein